VATRIRLARRGTHKRPYYAIVVAGKAAARDGAFIERLGDYDPLAKDDKSKIDLAKAQAWLSKGARPTDTVVSLLKVHGIEVPVHLMDKKLPSAGKQKAMQVRSAERKAKEEAKAKAEAARAKAKEGAKSAEGAAQPAAQ